jgi:hypothetical protein
MNNNFFPLCSELIESQEFKTLPCTEKIFLIQLISDSNRNPDGWYKADIEYASLLGLSLKKIRQARPRLKKMGFIDYESGQLKGNRKFATKYTLVKFSRPQPPFARVHRYTYEDILEGVRIESSFNHSHLLFWLISAYKNGTTKQSEFSVFKSYYADYGIKSKALAEGVEMINKNFHEPFIKQNYHKLTFTEWINWADPDVSEQNLKSKEKLDSRLKNLIDHHRRTSKHDEYWKEKTAIDLLNKGKSDSHIMEELGLSRTELKLIIADSSSKYD